jgi:hypothetical protein
MTRVKEDESSMMVPTSSCGNHIVQMRVIPKANFFVSKAFFSVFPTLASDEQDICAEFSPNECRPSVFFRSRILSMKCTIDGPGFYEFLCTWHLGWRNYEGKLIDRDGVKYLQDKASGKLFLLAQGCDPIKRIWEVER